MHMCMCRSEDNLLGMLLPVYYLSPQYQTQVIVLGSKCLYPLIQITGTRWYQFENDTGNPNIKESKCLVDKIVLGGCLTKTNGGNSEQKESM